MPAKKSRKRKSIRRRLINIGQLECFYCGLPFHIFILPKGSPGAAKSRWFSRVTLEHIQAVSNNGETTKENCVLAHAWCNATAANRLVADKLALKQMLSNNNGIPPWWPTIEKIIAKENL